MVKKNQLFAAPPYPVEQSLKQLGINLRTARLRRNMTIDQICQKIGTGPRAVADAEKGKLTTGIAVYAALLWALDLLNQLNDVALPEKDIEGQQLALSREPARAKHHKEHDNDF